MAKFRMKVGLGGGFGGCEDNEWQDCSANTLDNALVEAFEACVDEYEQYDGMHGLLTREELAEEHGITDEGEIEALFREEVEIWADYIVEEIE